MLSVNEILQMEKKNLGKGIIHIVTLKILQKKPTYFDVSFFSKQNFLCCALIPSLFPWWSLDAGEFSYKFTTLLNSQAQIAHKDVLFLIVEQFAQICIKWDKKKEKKMYKRIKAHTGFPVEKENYWKMIINLNVIQKY